MKIDVYIILRFVVIFSEFLSFICSVLHVSPNSVSRHRDRCRTVPAESAAETVTLNHIISCILVKINTHNAWK